MKKYAQKGFNLIESIIVISVIGVLAAAAVPSYLRMTQVAEAEKALLDFYALVELGQSEALKRRQDIHIHFVPPTEDADGCVGLSEDLLDEFTCFSDEQALKNVSISHASTFDLFLLSKNSKESLLTKEKLTLFYIKHQTMLPSENKTFEFSPKIESTAFSRLMIRPYENISGCSETGILDWKGCGS